MIGLGTVSFNETNSIKQMELLNGMNFWNQKNETEVRKLWRNAWPNQYSNHRISLWEAKTLAAEVGRKNLKYC